MSHPVELKLADDPSTEPSDRRRHHKTRPEQHRKTAAHQSQSYRVLNVFLHRRLPLVVRDIQLFDASVRTFYSPSPDCQEKSRTVGGE